MQADFSQIGRFFMPQWRKFAKALWKSKRVGPDEVSHPTLESGELAERARGHAPIYLSVMTTA